MKENKYASLPYFIFVVGLFLSIISFNFLCEGMFMDGLYYSCISHKLADGQCTLWHLTYTDFNYNPFYGHPPLAMLLQSWFLNIFGDNVICDKIYSVLTYIITGLLMCLVWKRLVGDFKSAWMPLLFWITIPLVIWGSTNNVLENTMSIFVVASIFFCLDEKRPYLSSMLAGSMVFLAFMVKGPTSLFPLAFPVIQYSFQNKMSLPKCLLRLLIMVASCLAIFALMLLLSDDARYFFGQYYDSQIVGSFNGKPTIGNRFYIVWRCFCEIFVGVAILIVAFVIKHKTKTFKQIASLKQTLATNADARENAKKSLGFFLLGLCGVVPMIVSMKQSGFYIISTMPFFAISMALLFRSIFTDIKGRAVKYIVSCLMLAVAIALNIVNFGKISRDKDLIHDIKAFGEIAPKNEVVLIPQSLGAEYSLRCYMSRYNDATLTVNDNNCRYMILPKYDSIDNYEWGSRYKKIDINTEKYNFYITK